MNVFSRVQLYVFFAALLGTSAFFLWLIQDFIAPVVWALVLALLFHPIFVSFKHRLRGRENIAALLTIITAIVIVFLPVLILGGILVHESTALYRHVLGYDEFIYEQLTQAPPYIEKTLALIGVSPEELYSALADGARTTSTWLASQAFSLGSKTFSFFAGALVMLYILFFLLRDGLVIGAKIMRTIPLGDAMEVFLFERFSTAVRATVKGSLVVALAQGATGALLLWLGDIPNPVFWGMLMALFSLLPVVGPALVWIPAAIVAYVMGNIVGAAIVFFGGLFIVSNVDNYLRAILVGQETNMPDAFVLVSVLGGIATFGISGIIFGPVVAALFLAMWELFEHKFRNELIERG